MIMESEDSEVVLNLNLMKEIWEEYTKWQYADIPDGQVISGIGLTQNESRFQEIERISFNLATIKNFVKVDRSKEIPKIIERSLKFLKVGDESYSESWPNDAQMQKINKPMKL